MRKWIALIAALLAIALMLWIGYGMCRGIVNVLGGMNLTSGERDPMFAEEAELVTRPPELPEETPPPDRPTLDDYVPEVESPVTMTVEELIREAEEKAAGE